MGSPRAPVSCSRMGVRGQGFHNTEQVLDPFGALDGQEGWGSCMVLQLRSLPAPQLHNRAAVILTALARGNLFVCLINAPLLCESSLGLLAGKTGLSWKNWSCAELRCCQNRYRNVFDAETRVEKEGKDGAEKMGCNISGVRPRAPRGRQDHGSSKPCPALEFNQRPMFAGMPTASGCCWPYKHAKDIYFLVCLQGKNCCGGVCLQRDQLRFVPTMI